jgi:hypothetical protein
MSVFVLKTHAAFGVLRRPDGELVLYEPPFPEAILLDAAPGDFDVGALDYSIPGNPLFDVV